MYTSKLHYFNKKFLLFQEKGFGGWGMYQENQKLFFRKI